MKKRICVEDTQGQGAVLGKRWIESGDTAVNEMKNIGSAGTYVLMLYLARRQMVAVGNNHRRCNMGFDRFLYSAIGK